MADPDLTTRARAVLAGLTKAMRAKVLLAAKRGFWMPEGASEWSMCRRMEIVPWENRVFWKHRHTCELTDLGREVARLLTEEADRG